MSENKLASLNYLGTVYVIDTDPDTESRIKHLFRRLNVDLQFFGSAHDFLKALPNQHKNSCLITEVDLPDMTGIELLLHLQKNNRSLPTIFLTNKSSVQSAVQAMQAKAVDYMEKPFIERNLYEQIKKVLSISPKETLI